jgi:glycosyltransferase involved in cell wall biosynthesis
MTRKILFVVNVDWFFLSHRLPIALEAQRQGFEVHIATRLTDKLGELRRHGLIVHVLGLDRTGASLVNAWLTGLQLWRVLRAVRPDVMHLVTIKPILLGGVLARLMRVPALVVAVSGLGYVFMSHGSTALVRRGVVSLLYRVALTHPNLKVIFQNSDDLRSMTDIVPLPGRQVVILRGSGVDLAHFVKTPRPTGVPVVMLAARLLADKGVFEFVEAARILKARGCLARFVLVGTVDSANPTSVKQAELDAWVTQGVVEWWGQRSDMAQVLAAAQVVVLPSYREGLPKVLLEAAACGRSVVTTDVPGCRDAIDPGVTGLLVPVRNASALALTMDDLINNPARCQVMGDAGRVLAERAFDVRQVVDEHLRIYSELIENS